MDGLLGDNLFIGEDDEYERYQEYERRKKALVDLPPKKYDKAIKTICEELGI